MVLAALAKVVSGNEATRIAYRECQGSSYARYYQRRMGDARRARGDAGNDGGAA